MPSEVVTGCKIKVEDMEFGDVEEFYIVGSQEAKPIEGRISDESPFGMGMLGKKVGAVVEVEAPVGIVKYQIMDIQK